MVHTEMDQRQNTPFYWMPQYCTVFSITIYHCTISMYVLKVVNVHCFQKSFKESYWRHIKFQDIMRTFCSVKEKVLVLFPLSIGLKTTFPWFLQVPKFGLWQSKSCMPQNYCLNIEEGGEYPTYNKCIVLSNAHQHIEGAFGLH